jgi:hypothetical protein
MGPGERGPRRRTLRVRADAPGVEAELDEEVRFHLEKKVEALMAEGWSREDAEAEAHRRFGDVNEVKRGMRRMTRKKERKMMVGGWREAVFQDIRYALRTLREKPLFAVVVSLTLALGIGVNTAIFSVVDGILFRPLPFPEPDELVVLWTDVTARGGPDDEWFSYANFRDVRDEAASLEAAAAWGGWSPTWTDTQEPQQLGLPSSRRGCCPRCSAWTRSRGGRSCPRITSRARRDGCSSATASGSAPSAAIPPLWDRR